MPAILPVRITEPSLELRLLDKRDVDEVEDKERGCPYAMRRRQQHERLAEEDEDHPRDHGIANEPIGATDDERTRRVPWSQGAFPLGCEAPQRGEKEKKAHSEQRDADQLKGYLAGGVAERWCNGVPLGDPDRHENSDGERKDRDREQMTEQPDHFSGTLESPCLFLRDEENGFSPT